MLDMTNGSKPDRADQIEGGLVVDGVSLSIRSSRILHGISFQAQPGRVSAIIGPNGSGKSTLLKAMIGERAFTGRIHICGLAVASVNRKALALRRAVLAQHTSVAFPLTVHEVVQLGAGVRGPETGSFSIAAALSAVDLEGFSGRSYQSLSGGEQQRVQLARVLCQVGAPVGPDGPRWLFLDEPVSSLDIKHQLWVMRFARQFAQAGGGVLAVMHDLNLTAQFADDILALKRGRALAHGTTREVITSPLVSELYDCSLAVGETPQDDMPFILPQTATG